MKLKGFTGTKRCKDGEIYRFKKGVAVVPGMFHKSEDIRFSRKPYKITLLEFKELNK